MTSRPLTPPVEDFDGLRTSPAINSFFCYPDTETGKDKEYVVGEGDLKFDKNLQELVERNRRKKIANQMSVENEFIKMVYSVGCMLEYVVYDHETPAILLQLLKRDKVCIEYNNSLTNHKFNLEILYIYNSWCQGISYCANLRTRLSQVLIKQYRKNKPIDEEFEKLWDETARKWFLDFCDIRDEHLIVKNFYEIVFSIFFDSLVMTVEDMEFTINAARFSILTFYITDVIKEFPNKIDEQRMHLIFELCGVLNKIVTKMEEKYMGKNEEVVEDMEIVEYEASPSI